MYGTKAMLVPKHPMTNNLWEDLDKAERTWKKRKATYTRANRKAVVKRMAAANVNKNGGAATAAVAAVA